MKLPYSVNNRIVVEPYKKEELKAQIKGGLALIGQKQTVKGLKLLVDADWSKDMALFSARAGDTVYIKEEVLHNHPSVKGTLQSDAIQGEFLVLDASLIEFVVPKQEETETYERP